MTRVRLQLVALALFLLVCGFLAATAQAADGIVLIDPDQPSGSFDPNDATYDLNGKIVIAGTVDRPVDPPWGHSFLTIRVSPDGTLDPTFGAGGVVLTNVAVSRVDGASACAVQQDGKVISAGGADNNKKGNDFALVRYQPDGSLDKTFNKKGIVTTDFGGNEGIHDIAVQADGTILATGAGAGLLTARYTKKGLIDASFGQGAGYVRTTFAGGYAYGHRVLLSTDGILVAGQFSGAAGDDRVALARYDVRGDLDGSFGAGGTLTLVLPGYRDTYVETATLYVDLDAENNIENKILIGGYSVWPGPTGYRVEATLARLKHDGSLDDTFGELVDAESGARTGFARLDFGGMYEVTALAVQSDGKIVAAGWSWSDPWPIVVARFNIDGSLDEGFGENAGWTETAVTGTSVSFPVSVLIDPLDGGIVVVGTAGGRCALLRYLSDGTLDLGF
jgi:uncharacterized delta-60 repeat protein